MLLVVARFLDRLAGDGGKLGVARIAQALPHQLEPGGQRQVAQHGEGEVAARQLGQGRVAVVDLIAQEGELVFVPARAAALATVLAGQGQQRPRLTDQVERHVRQRDVLLEDGPVAAPLAEALAEDQAGVAKAQQIVQLGRGGNAD
jgi:hypothetical protein